MKIRVPLITVCAFVIFISCTSSSLATKNEKKHPGYYLTGKGKVISQTGDSVWLKLTIKNNAKRTSYKNMELLVQLKKKDGSSSCSFGRKFQSSPIRPKRKQKIYYTLHCPNAEAYTVEFLNIYGDTIAK